KTLLRVQYIVSSFAFQCPYQLSSLPALICPSLMIRLDLRIGLLQGCHTVFWRIHHGSAIHPKMIIGIITYCEPTSLQIKLTGENFAFTTASIEKKIVPRKYIVLYDIGFKIAD